MVLIGGSSSVAVFSSTTALLVVVPAVVVETWRGGYTMIQQDHLLGVIGMISIVASAILRRLGCGCGGISSRG